jgi:hypothetical protein
MFNARKFIPLPLPLAVAAGTVARVGGSFGCPGHPDTAHPTALFPIRRGVMR